MLAKHGNNMTGSAVQMPITDVACSSNNFISELQQPFVIHPVTIYLQRYLLSAYFGFFSRWFGLMVLFELYSFRSSQTISGVGGVIWTRSRSQNQRGEPARKRAKIGREYIPRWFARSGFGLGRGEGSNYPSRSWPNVEWFQWFHE